MTEQAAPLTGVLKDIARVAGEEAALKIAHARGGTEIYLPPKPGADHWLSELVGQELAQAIADDLTCGISGMRVELPIGPRSFAVKPRAEVDRMIRAGMSERDIALATGYTNRGVRKRRAKLGEVRDTRQGNLFED